jgi:Dynamin family
MDPLETLGAAAREVGAADLSNEIDRLRERLREGRFFVMCVGQFKRGKSSLLNALVGDSVLPVGIVPVTAVVTVLRYGQTRTAIVRFASGRSTAIDPGALGDYVSEAGNPGNNKGVGSVEVFLPSSLLRDGMCIVDTPGLGSVFEHNTETTRAAVPHVDAALLVLGADPPLSGAELDLVEETSRHVDRLLVAMNKSDRLTEDERTQGRAFASRFLAERLGRDVEPILEVSAKERADSGPTRDWLALERALRAWGEQGRAIVADAARRASGRYCLRIRGEIEEQRAALRRPIEASVRRVESLRGSLVGAERLLQEMGYLFASVQDRLTGEFRRMCDAFRSEVGSAAHARLSDGVDRAIEARESDVPRRAMELAQRIAREGVEGWRRHSMPSVEALYRQAVDRFAEAAIDFLREVADPNDPALASLPETFSVDTGLRARPRFFFTDVLHVSGPTVRTRLADLLRAGRAEAIKEDAGRYLDRLLETNSARAANDFADQVLESRRRMEADLRRHLGTVAIAAERALRVADERRAAGDDAVAARLVRLDELARAVDAVDSK